MYTIIFLALTLGIIILSISITAAIGVRYKNETSPHKKEEVAKRRVYPPKFTSVPSSPEDERERMVDYLLRRKHLTLDEMQYIYDFLMDTGKEKWRYIEGYWGYYRISSTGLVESCRRHNYLDPSLNNKRFQVALCVNGENKAISIHKVVAETFIPNPTGAVSVRPKDGNYLHCDVRNLMWKPKMASSKIAVKMAMTEAA